jgi:hypothetical protein
MRGIITSAILKSLLEHGEELAKVWRCVTCGRHLRGTGPYQKREALESGWRLPIPNDKAAYPEVSPYKAMVCPSCSGQAAADHGVQER